MGLLLKVMALQKLAWRFTAFCVVSMMIWDPFVWGWKSRGLMDRAPHCGMGRQCFCLWWHRWEEAENDPPMESESTTGKKGLQICCE